MTFQIYKADPAILWLEPLERVPIAPRIRFHLSSIACSGLPRFSSISQATLPLPTAPRTLWSPFFPQICRIHFFLRTYLFLQAASPPSFFSHPLLGPISSELTLALLKWLTPSPSLFPVKAPWSFYSNIY